MAIHLSSVTLHPDRYPTREHYPFSLPALQQTTDLRFETPVTLFVGENGTGKSTVLEAMAAACGIHIWRCEQVTRVVVNPFEDRLSECLTVEWAGRPVHGSFFGSSIFRDFTHFLDARAASDPELLDDFGGSSLVTQSHGQSCMAYFRNRYRIRGLYLLDEPETALSPRSQLDLLRVLRAQGQAEAQFIVATHSPILLACPGATILSFDHVPVRSVAYEDTSHCRLYRGFMADPAPFL